MTDVAKSVQHTPGPWSVSYPFAWKAAIKSPARYIGSAGRADGSHEEMQANACLLAAAPDLLAACEAALAHFEAIRGDFHTLASEQLQTAQSIARAGIDEMRVAIAKARETP